MEVVDFTCAHAAEARALAQWCYDEERRRVPALPVIRVPALEAFAENGLGAAAVEDGRLQGFLCCLPP